MYLYIIIRILFKWFINIKKKKNTLLAQDTQNKYDCEGRKVIQNIFYRMERKFITFNK